MVLRGLLKFLAVALAAGVVGAGLGIGLAELSGDDADPATPIAPRPATETAPAQTTTAPTATATTVRTTTAPAATTPTTTRPVRVSRTTRVRILSAVLYPASTRRGRARQRARVAVRVRLTSRSVKTLPAQAPTLIAGTARLRADRRATDVAGPLLRPLAPGKTATGELRFETTGSATRRLTNQRRARLSIAGRTVRVSKIRISRTPAPAG